MLTRQQAQNLAERILSASQFEDCSVSVSSSEEAQVRFANNGVTTAGFTAERSVTISSTREGRTGTIRLNDFDPAALKAAVARSEEMAALAPVNAELMPALGPQEYPALDKWDEETAAARSPVLIPQVKAAIQAAAKHKLVGAGFITRSASAFVVANKRGLFGYTRQADARMSTTVRAADGSSSGWAGQPSRRVTEIQGAELGARAAEKCLRWAKPARIEPGEYAVVLEPTAVSDLVQLPFASFLAREADEGRSYFSRPGGGVRLGEKLFPEIITLRSDPTDARVAAVPWANGLIPNRPIPWIEKGVLKNLAYSRYWAAKTGKQPTPGYDDLILEGTDASLEDLIGSVERGLLVTRFWYIRNVNPRTMQYTGLTRDGLFLIESGKVTQPVVNLRFNESPLRLLEKTKRLGRAVRARGGEGGGMVAPPLVAERFPFTSVSDAV